MGIEAKNVQDGSADDSSSNVLLSFCPTAESEEGKIDVTSRMTDLALKGFQPFAITRQNPEDTRYYMIFAKEGLSESLRNAVLNEAGSLVREALEASELVNHSSIENNNN